MRVLYFGGYDRAAGRNAILIEGLRAAGAEVAEAHARIWPHTEAKLAAARLGPAALAGLAPRLAWAWLRLLRDHGRLGPYDVMVVGATAHLDLWLAARLARRRGAGLVFDPLVSAAETLEDRELLPPRGRRMRALRAIERPLWSLPDTILADTATHGAAWREALGLGAGGAVIAPLPVGSPDLLGGTSPGVDEPGEEGDSRAPFRVLYFGQFIPLHGVEHILGAADRLRHLPWVRFDLVGRGQTLAAAQAGAAALGLPNLRIHPTWLPLAELHERFIRRADLCLGIFGHRPKAARVVPYKVYSALAAGRPVLSQDSPALREMLAPGVEVATVPPGDPEALAAAIASLAGQAGWRRSLAEAGHRAWRERFSPPVLGRRLVGILGEVSREM